MAPPIPTPLSNSAPPHPFLPLPSSSHTLNLSQFCDPHPNLATPPHPSGPFLGTPLPPFSSHITKPGRDPLLSPTPRGSFLRDPPAPPRSVAQAYVNQRKLDQEVKTLQAQAAQFAKQTGQWITMVENFNQALKVGTPTTPPPETPSPNPRVSAAR